MAQAGRPDLPEARVLPRLQARVASPGETEVRAAPRTAGHAPAESRAPQPWCRASAGVTPGRTTVVLPGFAFDRTLQALGIRSTEKKITLA